MFFDTHAHYDDAAFEEDREAVFSHLKEAGVELVINPGCNEESTEKALRLSESHDFIYFAAGLHPEDISSASEDWLENIRSAALHPKCLAIGEIGLDYYWDKEHKPEMKQVFRCQLELARELGLPVIVHDREAHGDCLELVSEFPELTGVFHCYSGSREMAEILLERGWYLGFDGPVTYKNARKTLEVLEITPLERILLETDSPYLSPVPMRGKRNDSSNLLYIGEKISEIKGIGLRELADITLNNGKNCFRID